MRGLPYKSEVESKQELRYEPIPTIRKFHESAAQIRCIVGAVGSGKTSGATWEIFYYLPIFLFKKYGMKKTRWVVVRNVYRELYDTTMRTIFEWFPFGHYWSQDGVYVVKYPDTGIEIEALFRSCDRAKDIKKFKSLEITGYWIDESIEVDMDIKKMVKNRIGRYPRMSPVRFGIETTNPPDTDDPTYSMFKWVTPIPGPQPEGEPLANHEGFWQPPYENSKNLRPGYYDELREDYRDDPDWIERYIEGKPGIIMQGKPVIRNFKYDLHVAKGPIEWMGNPLFIGMDDSGNLPAAVVVEVLAQRQAHILMEYWTEKYGIVDFGKMFVTRFRERFPDAVIANIWGDPAGEQKYSKRGGGFTSNAQLLREECGLDVRPSEQNPVARVQSIDQMLARVNGVLIDPSCKRLISGLAGGYCYPDYGMGRIGDKPIKNKYSHVVEALEYVMVKLFGPAAMRRMTPEEEKIYREMDEKRSQYDPLTWGL